MDCTKCKVALKEIMSRPRPKALLSAIDHSGIKTLEDVPESKENELRPSTLNIKCLDCSEEGIAMKARAYMEAPPMSVILCANRLQDQAEMEEALVHELVHVVDHAVTKMDLTSCQDLAYSEVRAAREAECHYSSHLCSWFKKQCVKSTAARSTSSLFPKEGYLCVAQVFEQAYKDTSPAHLNHQKEGSSLPPTHAISSTSLYPKSSTDSTVLSQSQKSLTLSKEKKMRSGLSFGDMLLGLRSITQEASGSLQGEEDEVRYLRFGGMLLGLR